MWAIAILSSASFLAICYIYGGYMWLLKGLVRLRRPVREFMGAHEQSFRPAEFAPKVCVFLSVHNEADVIQDRLANIYDTAYPLERLQTIVVSDGSTDATAEMARKFATGRPHLDIRVVEHTRNLGQAAAQNEVARLTDAQILVSTDAGARFTRETLVRLVVPFRREEIAVVGGVVIYEGGPENPISRGYQRYRRMEESIRALETRLGLLVKVDGPCVAYLRSIWSTIEPFEDVDQVIILLARKHGKLAMQEDMAYCYDSANEYARQEVRQRARMTRKALLSTFNRWGARDMLTYPGFTWALFSHKILRFFSPIFFSVAVVSSLVLFSEVAIGIVGVVGLLSMLAIPRTRGLLIAFLLAQLGFLQGVVGWLSRDKTGFYLPTRADRESASE